MRRLHIEQTPVEIVPNDFENSVTKENLTLRWALGLFSGAIGVLMLVTPHQFDSPAYATLQPAILMWGFLFMASGSLLLALDFLAPRRWLQVLAHTSSAGMFLLLAMGFLPVGLWRGTVVYSVLGLSLLVSLYQMYRTPDSRSVIIDLPRVLAALLVGAGIATFADVGLGALNRSTSPLVLPAYTAALLSSFVVSGVAVLVTETQLRMRAFRTFAQLLMAGTMITWAVAVSLPNGTWTGVVLYGGFGLLLAAWPWFRDRMHLFRPTSLHTRLALALVLMTAVPLIAATTVITAQEEQAATARALREQRVLASTLARSVSDYLIRYGTAVETLSNFEDLLTLPPASLADLLADYQTAYPEVTSFSVFDSQGQPVIRSDEREGLPASGRGWFQEVRDLLQPATTIAESPLLERQMAYFAAPLLDSEGSFLGAVVATVETSRLIQLFDSASQSRAAGTFLVDAQGAVVGGTSGNGTDRTVDLSSLPSVAALAAGEAGEMIYPSGRETVLAAYARVPDSELGVVVEQGSASALAGARKARELAFIFLLFTIALAGLAGAYIARLLANPLKRLAVAATSLVDPRANPSLPVSDVDEIAQLSDSFREMRHQLGERTAERERAMDALESSQARLDAIFNQVIVGIAQIHLSGNFDLVNQRFAELVGHTPSDLRAVRFEEIVHPEDREKLRALLEKLSLDGEDFNAEIRVCRPDGSSLWVETGGSVVRSVDGVIEHLLVAVQDISIQKAAQAEQEQLLASERAARQLEDRANSRLSLLAEAGVVLTSSLSHRETLDELARLVVPRLADWCVIDLLDGEGELSEVALVHVDPEKEEWGRDLRRQYRPNAHEARSTRVTRTGKPELIPIVSASDLRAAAQDEEHLALLRGLGASSVIVVPIVLDDEVIGALTVVRLGEGRNFDVHDLELVQELARRAAVAIENARLFERAQELNRKLELRVNERTAQLQAAISELETFNYTVSHDLRAPLRAVSGFSAALAEEFADVLGDAGRSYLERVQVGTEHMNQLIDGLLELSRLSTREMQRTTVNLSSLACRSADLLAADGSDEGTEFVIQEGLEVEGDKALLGAAMDNLIGNAWKFTRGTPNPRIEFGAVHGENGKTTYFIRDNGAGFDMRYASQLFVPFQRLHPSSEFEGTGIGLATVQRIIHRHGGKVWAESEPGKGAEFYFTLEA